MLLLFDLWTNFTSNGIFQYALSAYSNLEPWTFPLIFVGIMGYVYVATKSVVAFIVSVFLTLGVFATTTSIFANVEPLNLFLFIVTIFGLSLAIYALIDKVVERI